MAKRRKTGKSQPGRLRIVAGNWRSRLLDIVGVEGLRPTSERIRETLFNWLAQSIHGARCLDLFAGTGALGLEALSRGAKSTVFVEKSPLAARKLEEHIRLLDAAGATVLQTDAMDYLRSADAGAFDIVFLDPPFAAEIHDELCRLLARQDLLAPQGLVYIEQPRSQEPVALPKGWQIIKNKTAGNVRYMLVQQTD